uniref:Slc42a-2 n=1 Tax=Schmidtea mediterranea TaxID=79327 RepID=A0A0H3YFM5_SCHMD|nr:slc42a-2 [Schmidtea mediterranea]
MKSFQGPKFGILAFILQIGFLLIFGFCVRYKDNIDATMFPSTSSPFVENRYFYFQDVQGMMFLGFGFLMVFLKKYGFSSIGFNFFLCVFTIEWAIIMIGVKHLEGNYIKINVEDLLNAEFTLAAILISFGAVLGKLSPLQYMLMALMEVPICAWNEYLGREKFHAVDAGDTIFVHTFGAYFGLGCAWVISGKDAREHENEESSYNSDLFSMLGTLVLWIFWPSFNAGGASADRQQRAVVNTVISLCGSAFMTFVINSFITVDESDEKIKGKFNMVYIQNATLAGGVAVGACADLMIQPWGALLIGSVAGILSTLGYRYITPALTRIYLHDTCGVNNLHGMPGIMGGIGSAVAASIADSKIYGNTLTIVFSQMPTRSASEQAGYQLAALGCTIAIGLAGGAFVGVLLRFIPICDKPKKHDLFNDNRFWTVPEETSLVEVYESDINPSVVKIDMKKF